MTLRPGEHQASTSSSPVRGSQCEQTGWPLNTALAAWTLLAQVQTALGCSA
jgi:hypothetical protein